MAHAAVAAGSSADVPSSSSTTQVPVAESTQSTFIDSRDQPSVATAGVVDASSKTWKSKFTETRSTSRFSNFGPFNVLFAHVDPLVYYGYRNRLEQSDLFYNPSFQTKRLWAWFSGGIAAQKARHDKLNPKEPFDPILSRILFAGNIGLFIWTGFLYAVSQASQLVGPLMLKQIVTALQCYRLQHDRPDINFKCQDRTYLYNYVVGLLLAPIIQSLAENHMSYQLMIIGTRMRNTLMAAIFRKCLRLSNASIQAESTGKVVTLMSNDAQKMQDAMFGIHSIWGSPIFIAAVMFLLYQEIKWAAFVGLAVMMLLAPITGKVGATLAGLRAYLLKFTDKRVGYMNEVINGIQMIKFYAWEKSFEERILERRMGEAKVLKRMTLWQGLFGVVLFAGPTMVAIFSFGAYALGGYALTTAKAYTALSLFTLLRFPMTFLPMMVTMLINALVALHRIKLFLNRQETEPLGEELQEGMAAGEVKISDGAFSWDEAAEKPTLQNVNLHFQPGSLNMVVGTVGCGKSSLLAALLGIIGKKHGSVKMGGKIAYVPQTAWIINDTLQENIILGSAFDAELYERALNVSQLGPDLALLPNADRTEIGDRGVTLSGGQKQRISIARAVYHDADVYLMDDPLSAVDAHVGRALFEQCIRGAMRNKTIILVTNALQYLPDADNVVWIDAGKIRAQGPYQLCMDAGLNAAELFPMERNEEDDEHEEGESVGEEGAGGKKPKAKKDLKRLGSNVSFRGEQGGNRNLTGEEERAAGNLSTRVVSAYIKAAGGWPVLLTLIGMLILEQGTRVFTDTWVGFWFSDLFNQSLWFYLSLYCALGVLYAVVTYLRGLRLLYSCVNAAVNLHNALLHHILKLPKSFFDTNPAGRVLNRFSRDTEIMDSTLAQTMSQLINCLATFASILIVICVATRWFTLIAIPLLVIYFFIQRYYMPTARELQRIESITRSPIYTKFAEALAGVTTIRAYRKETHFVDESDDYMELNSNAFITQKIAAAWLAMRLDVLGIIVVVVTGVLCVSGSILPTLAGLCLTYALDMTRYLKFGTQVASQAESYLNSVERVLQYMDPKTEADPETKPDVLAKMPKQWPNEGHIQVVKLKMKYRPDTPLVLHGVSFEVLPGEKVGIVGRTGSGKSSLLFALFRMVEPFSGTIIMDGVDIQTVGLRQLRSSMSIIPQDPFMFSGTVRINLDPFEQYEDAQLWQALEAVGLQDVVNGNEGGLAGTVADNGSNYSLGQRQLFCLARAMLRKSRVLMLDEATASIDPETDALIQQAIRKEFGECTMLTIAHRLNTIMDADRVIVLKDGEVQENGEPKQLLDTPQGAFTSMVKRTGSQSSLYLRDLARSASDRRSIKRANSNTSLATFTTHGSQSLLGFNSGALTGFNSGALTAHSGHLDQLTGFNSGALMAQSGHLDQLTEAHSDPSTTAHGPGVPSVDQASLLGTGGLSLKVAPNPAGAASTSSSSGSPAGDPPAVPVLDATADTPEVIVQMEGRISSDEAAYSMPLPPADKPM